MENLLINVDYGLTSAKVVHNCSIHCRRDTIFAIGGKSAFSNKVYEQTLDFPDCYAIPGFIDSHLYGFCNQAFNSQMPPEAYHIISESLAEHGVTSFCPSLQSSSIEEELGFLENFRSMQNSNFKGAQAVGIHMIGPFINPDKKGSNPERNIRKVDLGELDEILQTAGDSLKIMTLAPEIPGTIKVIEKLLEHGVTPSMGHSNAQENEVLAAIDAGCHRCTQLFNAMTPIHQRNIGLTSIALVDDRIKTEIIFDGYHVHPHMLDLACRAKTSSRVIAVSGASQDAGIEKLNAKSAEKQFCYAKDGTISGSILTQEQSWKNMLQFSQFSLPEAISCFTVNPANDLGLEDRGRLRPGMQADIVIMNKDHEVEATFIKGRPAYLKDPKKLQ